MRESIMLAARFANLGGILSGPVTFFEFEDFIILFMSLGLAFGKSVFTKFLRVSFILTKIGLFLYSGIIFLTLLVLFW